MKWQYNGCAPYEEWVEQARQYELNRAHRLLKAGRPPAEVLEEMSYRLQQKMLDPLYEMIEQNHRITYDSTVSKAEYEEYFKLKNIGPKADHVEK